MKNKKPKTPKKKKREKKESEKPVDNVNSVHAPQKELDHDRISPLDITEYEANFIPNPKGGPWESDDAFTEYHCFEFFDTEMLVASINEFKELLKIKKMPLKDYVAIENGIRSFTQSSTKLTREKALLYKSILTWSPNIVTEKFNRSTEDVQQLIGAKYFENFQYIDDSFKFKPEELISKRSLSIYRKCAEYITLKALTQLAQYSIDKDGDTAWTTGIDDIKIYRGVNNSKYYVRRQKKGDMLSIYAGMEDDSLFFEKGLLTSYTLSPNLAEQFMVGSADIPERKSKRRVIVNGKIDIIEGRLFSSFIVSPNFDLSQYEFIVLPDTKYLKLHSENTNEIYTTFDVYNSLSY